MIKNSAGILLFSLKNNKPTVLLVHPGGPFWAKKDAGAWSIPKGEIEAGEDNLITAKRELFEEVGIHASGPFIFLKPITLQSGKIVTAWAMRFEDALPPLNSNTFEMEWPPKSGKKQFFPEVDKANWFSIDEGMEKINFAQQSFITQLMGWLSTAS